MKATRGAVWQEAVWAAVDWDKAKVVYGPGPAFYINKKGRDAHGIVTDEEYEALRDQIIAGFKGYVTPKMGWPLHQTCIDLRIFIRVTKFTVRRTILCRLNISTSRATAGVTASAP
ncbi:MAG: hypothetical protein M9918_11190 [Anaerolineae bacterium]|nr:hypothetical protein [Anaerolineae bacterium]